jgi:hypothetical protein
MNDAVIVDVVRLASGRGKAGGALFGCHPVELLRQVFGRTGHPQRARSGTHSRGDGPLLMLTAPIPATERVLHRGGLTLDDIDVCLKRRGRYGLQTMCEGGGLANARIIERL